MVRESEIREGELAVDMPAPRDAGLIFIGRIRTPWTSREDTPRQGRHDGPVCRLEIFEPWVAALKGVDFYSNLEVIYWLHQSRRDLENRSSEMLDECLGADSKQRLWKSHPLRFASGALGSIVAGINQADVINLILRSSRSNCGNCRDC